jgi:hypothetical protein
MEPQPVEGVIDTLIKKYLTDALKDASFDHKIFLGHPETKKAAQSLAISLKAAAKLPFDLDDRGIDYALAALEAVLDQYKDVGPVKVGATPEPVEARKRNSDQEINKELRKVGIDPATIGLIATLILRYAPDLIAAIKKLLGK